MEKREEIKRHGGETAGTKTEPSHSKYKEEKKIIVEAEKNHYEMRQRRGKE